jgi:predicted nuclease of predicted toxin-antitoxin system
LKFLIDAQLPPALARWIASHGHEATHVFDLTMQTATDAAVWAHAAQDDRILITKDEDFVDRWLLSDAPIGLLWIRKGNCSNEALMTWLEPLWLETIRRLEQGERLIELRG